MKVVMTKEEAENFIKEAYQCSSCYKDQDQIFPINEVTIEMPVAISNINKRNSIEELSPDMPDFIRYIPFKYKLLTIILIRNSVNIGLAEAKNYVEKFIQ